MTIILLTLIANHAMGQVDYSKKTDRFSLSSTLRYQRGKEINKELIEMFKYAGNLEGKRWWTGYYVPKQEFPDKDASEEVKETMRKKRQQDMEEYEDKEEEMQKIHPCYQHLFINATSFYPPHALSYDSKDTTLVTLSPGKETASSRNIEMGKNTVRIWKMKVNRDTYNSIQTLHMLVIYTALPMDAISGHSRAPQKSRIRILGSSSIEGLFVFRSACQSLASALAWGSCQIGQTQSSPVSQK